MGLDAVVHCRCWAEGRTVPPPVPPQLIRELPDGDLDLDLPEGAPVERWHPFDRWRIDACAHEDGWYARERIGSWGEVVAFRECVGAVGGDRYRLLGDLLPEANGGTVEPSDAAARLAELSAFTELLAVEPLQVVATIRALRVVLEAAVAIDRPVVWC